MADPIERAVVASGEATVRRVPDVAVVALSVTVTDKRPGRARDEANRRASAILARLRELGVPDADVQAPSLVVHPRYDYSRGESKVTGFEAARPMTIRVRDVDLLGTILDELVDGGATRVHGTSMELADPDAASREALAGAVAAARGRAEAMAVAAGVTLGDPVRIEEEMGEMPVPRGMGMLRAAATEVAPTEVAAGEVEISARVRAWFVIS
jgi:uncharacterized protein YggE